YPRHEHQALSRRRGLSGGRLRLGRDPRSGAASARGGSGHHRPLRVPAGSTRSAGELRRSFTAFSQDMPSRAQSSCGKVWRHVQDRKTPAVYAFDVPLPSDLAAQRGEVVVLLHPAPSGSVIAKVAPPPGVGRASAVPPCASTTAATIESPRPAPPLARARELAAR